MNFSKMSSTLLLVAIAQSAVAQDERVCVGMRAPSFQAAAYVDGQIIDQFSLDQCAGRYKILVFYPLDFTFVCPTELHAFQARLRDFTARNAIVMAISVDSVHAHRAWAQIPREQGGIQGVTYPLISDLSKKISECYGVLSSEGMALRGLFIIDDENIVQSMLINNLPLGRNVEEVIRLLDAVQHSKESGMVCPANWTPSQEDLEPTLEGVQHYFQNNL